MNDKRSRGDVPRYGTDELYRFLLWAAVALALLRLWLRRGVVGWLLLAGVLASAGWALWRSLSRDLPARRSENRVFLSLRRKVRRFARLQIVRLTHRRTAAFRVCPECGAVIRLRRRRGEYTLLCPRCDTPFDIYVR